MDANSEERIVFETGHHWIILVPSTIMVGSGFLVGFFFNGFDIFLVTSAREFVNVITSYPGVGIGIGGIVLGILGLGTLSAQILKWLTMRVRVTGYNISWRVGFSPFTGTSYHTIGLNRIEGITGSQSVFGWLLGAVGLTPYGRVVLRGIGQGSILFDTVRKPYVLRDSVQHQMRTLADY